MDKVAGQIDGSTPAKGPGEPLPDPEAPVKKAISINELCQKAIFAAQRLSNKNPHKNLFMNLQYGLRQMMARVAGQEQIIADLKAELEGRAKRPMVTLD